jgi:hypothetical protein
MIALQREEKVLMEVRKHWLAICIHAIVLTILALVPLAIAPLVLQYLFPDLASEEGNLLETMYLFGAAAWLWFVWVMFFVAWTNYYLDVLVITNKRLIDMEQFVLFSRDEVTIPLTNIEDIKIEVIGFLATVFRFGNLQIQTAGAERETITKNIRRPELVRSCLESAVELQKRIK